MIGSQWLALGLEDESQGLLEQSASGSWEGLGTLLSPSASREEHRSANTLFLVRVALVRLLISSNMNLLLWPTGSVVIH